jgi:hypothetical protein
MVGKMVTYRKILFKDTYKGTGNSYILQLLVVLVDALFEYVKNRRTVLHPWFTHFGDNCFFLLVRQWCSENNSPYEPDEVENSKRKSIQIFLYCQTTRTKTHKLQRDQSARKISLFLGEPHINTKMIRRIYNYQD